MDTKAHSPALIVVLRCPSLCLLFLRPTEVAEVWRSGEECVGGGTVEVVASSMWSAGKWQVAGDDQVQHPRDLFTEIFEVRNPSPMTIIHGATRLEDDENAGRGHYALSWFVIQNFVLILNTNKKLRQLDATGRETSPVCVGY